MTVIDQTAVDRAAEYRTRTRSWSQLSSYEQCPKAFYLERIVGAWQKPAAWFSTGTAVHRAIELWERDGLDIDAAEKVAQEAYRDDVNERLADTPNPYSWAASGRYNGSVDIPRRYGQLRQHLVNYAALADGRPPLVESEMEVHADMDGVTVVGFVDQVREGEIVDLKAGSTVPKVADQMKVYAIAIEQAGGPVIEKAAFIMTAPTVNKVIEHDLMLISTESLMVRFRTMDDAVKAGDFDPTPGDQCRRCSVWSSCAEGKAQTRR